MIGKQAQIVDEAGSLPVTLDKLTISAFEECLGTSFQMESESGQSFDVELIEVSSLGTTASGPPEGRKPFSVLFRGDKDLNIGQGMVQMTHEKMGKMDLFIVPIGPDRQGMRLEAVFT